MQAQCQIENTPSHICSAEKNKKYVKIWILTQYKQVSQNFQQTSSSQFLPLTIALIYTWNSSIIKKKGE
jgi:hypothetical protein